MEELIDNNSQIFAGFTNLLQEEFKKMDRFCRNYRHIGHGPYIKINTLLAAMQYLKVHVATMVSKKGQINSIRDLCMFHVDAMICLRLAIKMGETQGEMLRDGGWLWDSTD